MKNFYELLQISQDASPVEIKKAYHKMLRRFPPEKCESKYIEIRDAYNILKDSESRKNYDKKINKSDKNSNKPANPTNTTNHTNSESNKKRNANKNYDKKINMLKSEADKLISNKEYSQAETTLKKILIFTPKDVKIKKELSDVLSAQQKYSESLTQLNELISLLPTENYYTDRARIYEKLGDNPSAEQDYIKAVELNHLNNKAINSLIYFYTSHKYIDKAIAFLDKNMSKKDSLNLNIFSILSKILKCCTTADDKRKIEKLVIKIQNSILQKKDDRVYRIYELIKFISILKESGYELFPGKIAELNNKVHLNSTDFKNYDQNSIDYYILQNFILDETVEYYPLKATVLYHQSKYYTQNKYNDDTKKLSADIKNLDEPGLLKIQNSIKILEVSYAEIYCANEDLFESIKKDLRRRLYYLQEFDRFSKTTIIIQPIKDCILGMEYTNDEQYDNGMDNLKKVPISELEDNIYRLVKFPIIKNKYKEFIFSLKMMCMIDPEKTDNDSDSHSGHSEGCYIATAVYGDYEAPEVLVLRRFRDEFLKRFILGRVFIKIYYTLSPGLAKRLKKDSKITKGIKKILDRFVNIIKNR